MSAYAPTLPDTSGVIRLTGRSLIRGEVADLLKMPVSTIYQLARRGEPPARRLGRTWRFVRPRLEELLAG
jgi:excisionase family DNA binding protein